MLLPRLPTGLLSDPSGLPVGERVWGDARVRLPEALTDRTPRAWRDILTGREFACMDEGNARVLRPSEVLADCPVAVLEAC